MDGSIGTSYVIETADQLPLHLKDRQPFVLPKADLILRRPTAEAIAEDGAVVMSGAIEFQTQIGPGILTDICDPDELYRPTMRSQYLFRVVYDPEIQRGVKETKTGPREFLRPAQIEAMMQDIEENRFECPQLMWNLRAGDTVWVYIRSSRELRVYQGVATRPDTNHRHHAIVNCHRRYRQWVEQTGSTQMGTYNPERAYGLVIYTDDFKGEAHRFYVYNFLGWRVPSSTAHFIESKTEVAHLHTRLARELMEQSPVLGAQNIEILSNHLSRNSAKMLTFGTLVDALKGALPSLTEDSYDDVRRYFLEFVGLLAKTRPDEISVLSVAQRQRVRNNSLVDQAVMWHGHIGLGAWLRDVFPESWRELIGVLGKEYVHEKEGSVVYSGDFFGRENPAWAEVGVVTPGKRGPRVVNNRQARQATFELLQALVKKGAEAAAAEVTAGAASAGAGA